MAFTAETAQAEIHIGHNVQAFILALTDVFQSQHSEVISHLCSEEAVGSNPHDFTRPALGAGQGSAV